MKISRKKGGTFAAAAAALALLLPVPGSAQADTGSICAPTVSADCRPDASAPSAVRFHTLTS